MSSKETQLALLSIERLKQTLATYEKNSMGLEEMLRAELAKHSEASPGLAIVELLRQDLLEMEKRNQELIEAVKQQISDAEANLGLFEKLQQQNIIPGIVQEGKANNVGGKTKGT
jgi:hypothetical protein